MTKRLKMVLSLLLICCMILPSNYVSAAETEQSDNLTTELKVVNPGYYDCFTISPDSSKQIKMKVVPKEASDRTLKWKTSNKSIVTVTDKGLIHGVTKGKAEITVSTTDGSNLTMTIPVVVGNPVKKIKAKAKKVTIIEGEKAKVSMKVEPANATTKELIWKSNNSKIAIVSSNGEITAISEGKTSVVAVAKDGTNVRATVAVIVTGTKVSQTLTDKDIVDGKITIKDKTLCNLTIDSSVGNAEITLDHVTVKGKLEMANGAKYTVYAKNSEINNVVALEENTEDIHSLALDSESSNTADTPTFIAEQGTLVVTVDARGNVTVKQEDSALIGTVTVNRTLYGKIELNLEGFSGNLVVNSTTSADITIVTSSCNIAEATISGTSAGQKLTLQDSTAEGKQSIIKKIEIETNAQVKVDVPAKELIIADTIEKAIVTIEKSIEKVTNEGKATTLTINSDITNVESTGEALEMKVAAGSEVTEVTTSGAGTKIDVALGSTINNIVSSGDNTSIGGNGDIKTVLVNGNDTVINSKTASVSVADDVNGTNVNDKEVSGGTQGTTPGSGASTPTPSQIPSENKTKITINNPGKIYAGKTVQLSADMSNISWSVYNHIDDTYGSATIDKDTGILHPQYDGYVRIVATSKQDSNVYGAVDVMIYDKKFVRMLPLEPITISQDKNLASIEDFHGKNILPTQAELIYETGNSSETETIIVDLLDTDWNGSYSGDVSGTYKLWNYFRVPIGYERPTDLEATVYITLNAEQTDTRGEVTGFEELGNITLTADEHLTDFYDVYYKYLDGKTVTLKCANGTSINSTIWFGVPDDQYNGTITGTYTASAYVTIPDGYVYNNLILEENLVLSYETNEIKIPVTIQVQEPQTADNSEINTMKDTTQPKFFIDNTTATINSVSLTGAPIQVYVGEIVNFGQFLHVDTTSVLASDKRVIWEVDFLSFYYINGITGEAMFNHTGSHTITATSVVDPSKSTSITVNVVAKDTLTVEPVAPITVNENLGIVDFKSLYTKLKDQLPKYIYAVNSNNQQVKGAVQGWIVVNSSTTSMTVAPYITWPTGYGYISEPEVTIELTVAQSTITGFEPYNDSNGAVGSLYFATINEYKQTLPKEVTTTNGVKIPVLSWTNENITNFGQVAATYTFTASLGALPFGYALADGVKATAQVTIAQTLSVESVQQFEDITIPLNYEQVVLELPDYIDVTLSDGITSDQWMPVTWNLNGFDATKEGTYTITGAMSKPNITNDKNLIPSINVIVHMEDTAVPLGIEIINSPYKLLYKQGEQLDTTGLRIVNYYSDYSMVEVVTGAAISISAFDSTSTGYKKLTVTYQGKSDSFKVYVDSIDTMDNTVLFVTDEMTMEAVDVVTGSAISYLPLEPTRNRFVFNGWYSEGNPVTADTVPIKDMVAYAGWDELTIKDYGIHSDALGHAVHEYALYRNGIKLTLKSTSALYTSIGNGNLYIDMYYAGSSCYDYYVVDTNGDTYIMTITTMALEETTATYTGIITLPGSGDYFDYELGIEVASIDYMDVYSYDTETTYGKDSNNNTTVGIPTNAVAGTYRYVIDINGVLYKTSIVIE